jgi:hypothetical protein
LSVKFLSSPKTDHGRNYGRSLATTIIAEGTAVVLLTHPEHTSDRNVELIGLIKVLLILFLLFFISCHGDQHDKETIIDLSGTWQFALDTAEY